MKAYCIIAFQAAINEKFISTRSFKSLLSQ
jgi:hypothetical protein